MMIRAALFLLWFFVWLLLSWSMDLAHIVSGILVSACVTFMTADLFSRTTGALRNPLRYLWLVYYFAVFAWESMKANFDVAYRVIHPDLPIRPGTIKVKTTLTSDTGLTFLTSSITLTPGTTSVDVDKENGFIYIHWLNVKEGFDSTNGRLAVVEKFETILKKVFG